MTHEEIMTLILVTIPTVLLAVVTIVANDRATEVAKAAIAKLSAPVRVVRRRAPSSPRGKHER